ncbi:MAG: PadR family transcriptional regulator [Candidatus Aenigmarchaeota archaeon]|nr:PadR family transcriptional regulator [Candidatus Aenigmarchaeota archaeon]
MPTPFERFRRSLTADNLWLYILALLKSGDLYAYEIRSRVAERFGFRPGGVTAYLVLKKLQAAGYVSIAGHGQGSGPVKTYYRLTAKGRQELAQARRFYQKTGAVFA